MARTATDRDTRTRLGSRLRNRRLQLGWTQDEAASAVGIQRDTYARWEQGRNFPDIDHLRRAQNALGIELTDLAARNAGLDEGGFTEILRPLQEAIQRLERQLEDFRADVAQLHRDEQPH